MFMEIAEIISAGQDIPAEKWEQLFATEGYRILDWKPARLESVKKNMLIAFSPARTAERDSILSAKIPLQDAAYFDRIMILNFTDMLKHWNELKNFRRTYDFAGMEAKSIRKLKNFLLDPVDSLIVFPSVAIVCADPEARSKSKGIVIDLNVMYKDPDGIIKLMAHEMFHSYRRHFENSDFIQSSPVITELDNLQNEGIADMIDKGDDLTLLFKQIGYPDEIAVMYKETFENTSAMLAEFDRITVSYLDGKIGEEELSVKIKGYFPFGGHPNGYFITRMLQRHGLRGEVIENFVNPVAFLRTYNKAAEKEGIHVFSPRFMNYMARQESKYLIHSPE
ncbi:Uncharacterised protein [Porphyromonas macacae]|uniref:DUF2268 domain-containing protein n=3 Tax=Porphyromonas macacae TaxID=28115 RepID=A0A379DKB9_9PORP|nr:Uncharacterised protein [Porphyromonas macacae]